MAKKQARKSTKKTGGRKYSERASEKVEATMGERKRGTLRSSSGQKVENRKQAIAIGLSEARREGARVPSKKTSRKRTTKKTTRKK